MNGIGSLRQALSRFAGVAWINSGEWRGSATCTRTAKRSGPTTACPGDWSWEPNPVSVARWDAGARLKLPSRIDSRPDVMMGKPCVRGTRIPVYLLLQKIAAGETHEMLLAAYPQLAQANLLACLEYAAALAGEEVVLAEA